MAEQDTKPKSKQAAPTDIVERACAYLHALSGRDIESVIGLERAEEGWTVRIEVVESRRVPDSADILGLYEIQVDNGAELIEYRRLRRYGRGRSGDE